MGVAPVSRWQLAGALDTRRLMGGAELEDNWAGYSEADLTRCRPQAVMEQFWPCFHSVIFTLRLG